MGRHKRKKRRAKKRSQQEVSRSSRRKLGSSNTGNRRTLDSSSYTANFKRTRSAGSNVFKARRKTY